MTTTPQPNLDGISELALQSAAQCWCDPTTQHLVMIPELAAVFARVLDAWINDAMRFSRNEDFYRGLLDQCADLIGPEAYTDDEGNLHDSPIRLKIPGLVKIATAGWKDYDAENGTW